MYEAAQVIVKLIIISAVVLLGGIFSIRVWRADLDLHSLFSPRRLIDRSVDSTLSVLPQRDLDAIYQDDAVVARVLNPTIDESNRRVFFQEIFNSNDLDRSREFEFQKYRLKFLGAETMVGLKSSQPQKGRIIEKAVCEIVGTRAAF